MATNTKPKQYTIWRDWRGQENFQDIRFGDDATAISWVEGDPCAYKLVSNSGKTLWERYDRTN